MANCPPPVSLAERSGDFFGMSQCLNVSVACLPLLPTGFRPVFQLFLGKGSDSFKLSEKTTKTKREKMPILGFPWKSTGHRVCPKNTWNRPERKIPRFVDPTVSMPMMDTAHFIMIWGTLVPLSMRYWFTAKASGAIAAESGSFQTFRAILSD